MEPYQVEYHLHPRRASEGLDADFKIIFQVNDDYFILLQFQELNQ
jgi:hypothetical protein